MVPDDIEGAVVLSISEPEVPDDEDNSYGEVIQFYATRFHTTRGDVTVEYRNSSNGYYGGSLERVWAEGESEALSEHRERW